MVDGAEDDEMIAERPLFQSVPIYAVRFGDAKSSGLDLFSLLISG